MGRGEERDSTEQGRAGQRRDGRQARAQRRGEEGLRLDPPSLP